MISLDQYLRGVEGAATNVPDLLNQFREVQQFPFDFQGIEVDEDLWEDWGQQVEWMLEDQTRTKFLQKARRRGRITEATLRLQKAIGKLMWYRFELKECWGIEL